MLIPDNKGEVTMRSTRLQLHKWVVGACTAFLLTLCPALGATLLPNGEQQFINGNGVPLAGGTVYMFVPNTSTCKNTWRDSGQTQLNTCPINLDSNGMALIYGAGTYRQVVYGCSPSGCDSVNGILLYDQLTADTSASNAIFWASTSGGTPNAITLVDASFASVDGNIIYFRALNSNSGATTLTVSGIGPFAIVRDTATGPVALIGGEIVTSNAIGVLFDSVLNQFHLIDSTTAGGGGGGTTASIVPPQGYLNLVGAAGGVVQTGDVVGTSVVYYSPQIGNQIPIYNGANFVERIFGELTLTLTAGSNSSSTIYDACVFNNSGNPLLVTGPAWATSTAGSGARGTGAGTPELFKLNGLWVNRNAITGNNNGIAYSVPALQCTYVGSLYIDTAAGQVSAYRTWGQSRKFGVWNAYNRVPIILQAGDNTASWTYNVGTIRASNNATANSLLTFMGLAEEQVSVIFQQFCFFGNTSSSGISLLSSIGIGVNVTNAYSGMSGTFGQGAGTGQGTSSNTVPTATAILQPGIGINTIIALEKGNATASMTSTFNGTNANMVLSARWNG